jgi:AraC-like DNA-binding protein
LHDADRLLDEAVKAESNARIQADALLRTDIDTNRTDINRNREGIAMVAAMTHTTLLPGNENAFDIGIANFESETAYSINFARRVKEGVQVNLSAMFRNKTGSKVNDGKMKFSEALNSNNPISELFFRLAFSSPSYFISNLLPVFSSLIGAFMYIQLSA